MTLAFTILGCGSSMGVPRVALGWGDCNPNNPKNRRRRCSLLVERRNGDAVTRVLIDTSPDLREQLLAAEVNSLDAVFFTHGHADHTHGIDDLRPLFIKAKRQVNVYLDELTGRALEKKFRYCFETPEGSGYPAILRAHRISAGRRTDVEGPGGIISVLPVLQEHGEIPSLGYRFNGLAYSCDTNGLPDESVEVMQGLDVWIVDALRDAPHPSHFTLSDALAWIERLKPRRAILTNLNPEFDYEALRARLPEHVEPAFDGMKVMLEGAPGSSGL